MRWVEDALAKACESPSSVATPNLTSLGHLIKPHVLKLQGIVSHRIYLCFDDFRLFF